MKRIVKQVEVSIFVTNASSQDKPTGFLQAHTTHHNKSTNRSPIPDTLLSLSIHQEFCGRLKLIYIPTSKGWRGWQLILPLADHTDNFPSANECVSFQTVNFCPCHSRVQQITSPVSTSACNFSFLFPW